MMIKLKTLLMEADAPKLKDTEKEKAKKLGLVWKGKGYGKEGQDGITHKNDGGKLVKIGKDGGKEDPKSKGLSGSDFDRELPSDDDGMEPSDLSDFDPIHDEPEVGTKVKDGKLKSSGPQQFADDVKNMKGEFDLDGGMKIKDGKMFDADGNEMDSDDIEDFYYQDAFDGDGNNIGIDVKEKPKSDEPVELDDDAQEAIDGMDWNRYDDKGITNVTKVINDLDDNVDEFNQQIYNVASELEGQIPQEDIDKLYSAEVNVMDLDDEALSEVPREELEKKTKILIDFHKKYSTLGKPKLDPKQKQRAQDDYNDAIRNIKNPQMAGGIEPYYVDMAADNLEKLGNPDAKVFKDLGKEFRDNLDDDGNPKDEKLDKQIQDKIKQAALDLETDITKETKEGIIKLKDVMRESKVSYLVEALQSKLLRKFTNRQDFKLDNDFYGWLARLGVRADKVTDDMIEKTAKLSGKGVVIAVTGKKVSLPAKGKSYWRSDLEVDKGVVLSVFKDGKAVWWTKSWRESDKNRKKDIRVADTKGYGFSTSENRTFGLNQFGYQNAASVKKINGVEFYKISLEESMPYMGGKEVRNLRSDIQVGSWKWRDDESFKRQNKEKYEDAIKAMYDDPEKVKAKVKRAKDYTDGLITGLIGGKPNAAAKKLLKGLSSTRAPEMQAMELMRNITDAMDRLYDKVTYYNNAVKDDIDYEKRNPEHPKSYRNAPRYGKEVAEIVNLILKNKFRGYY